MGVGFKDFFGEGFCEGAEEEEEEGAGYCDYCGRDEAVLI